MAFVDEAMKASMPGTAKQFLGTVQPKPMGQMIMYLGMLGILPIVGFVLAGLIAGGGAGLGFGLVMGIMTAIAIIAGAIAAGFILSAISQGSLGRQITPDEGITVVGYAATPVFVVAFLGGILTGIGGMGWGFGMFGVGGLLIWLGVLYMAFLVYMGAGARYGMDKAVVAALVALIVFGVAYSIVAWIGWSIALNMMIGAAYGYGYVPIPRGYPYY